ncbi:MAG: hypothetical protein EOP82_31205 [Variovorax sp.]|nr:MAG: hypothetical protein EOP82_31205 [Variovorax sp.]
MPWDRRFGPPVSETSVPPPERFAAKALQRWTTAVLMRQGVLEEPATLTARILVRTSLRGVDTHGLARLPMMDSQYALSRPMCASNSAGLSGVTSRSGASRAVTAGARIAALKRSFSRFTT